MAKLSWDKANKTKKVRDQGSEAANSLGPPEERGREPTKYETMSAEEIREKSRNRKPRPTVGESRMLERMRKIYERKRNATQARTERKAVTPLSTSRSQHAVPKKRGPTPFELAYLGYLRAHARAVANDLPRPSIPDAIQQRYEGKKLASWNSNALRTEKYASALRAAMEERSLKQGKTSKPRSFR
jgi:hypothetical protein